MADDNGSNARRARATPELRYVSELLHERANATRSASGSHLADRVCRTARRFDQRSLRSSSPTRPLTS
jgi:hypothetical protein